MKQINEIKERQRIALGVLEHLKAFCESNNIAFMLTYGTLLGAVRHKGFIPWDDDVDVMMTRPEYEKFTSLYDNYKQDRYKFISMETSQEYFAPLAKIYDDTTVIKQHYGQIETVEYGIYVDVFVIDDMPDNKTEASIFYKNAERLRFLWGCSVRSFNAPYSSIFSLIVRTPVMAICKIIGHHYWLTKYKNYSCKYNRSNATHSGIVLYGEGIEKEYHVKEMFTNLSLVSFEGKEYNAPMNVAFFLEKMYNDYMTIPEEKDRKIHPSNAYFK